MKFLDRTQEHKYLTYFYLNGIGTSKTLNRAWSILSHLSDNFSEREKVLLELKKFDPIPDDFLSKDDLIKKTYLRHLDNTFPEFIDYYSSTCQSYHAGTSHYPNGNPTIRCREFIKTYKSIKGEKHFKVKNLEKKYKIIVSVIYGKNISCRPKYNLESRKN